MNFSRTIDVAPGSDTQPAGRILIVSYWFPPFAAIASVRMGKLAKHLFEHGWDVRVLTADGTNPETLPVEIEPERVTYTPWSQVDRYLEDALARFRPARESSIAADASPAAEGPIQRKSSPLRAMARRAYQEIMRWPDNRAGWLKPATQAGHKLIGAWRPDVIFSTAPPVTSLIIADRLSRKHGIPWIAEFRDLWSDHPYYEYSPLRRWVERIWDQRVLTRAAAIVTVSPTWQPRIAARYGRPTIVAMNGFVASDFPETPPVVPETAGPLRIVYTGHIYRGHRDPTPLFVALRNIGATPAQVTVEFIGTEVEGLRELAAQCGVSDLVSVQPPVSYRRALELQLHADILLHMQWCDPKEEGTIAGKIFDYLFTRRPILGLALEDSVVAKMIHQRKAGLATNDPSKIATQVAAWIREKAKGGIAPLPASASEGLERAVQFEKIRSLLMDIVSAARDPIRARQLQQSG